MTEEKKQNQIPQKKAAKDTNIGQKLLARDDQLGMFAKWGIANDYSGQKSFEEKALKSVPYLRASATAGGFQGKTTSLSWIEAFIAAVYIVWQSIIMVLFANQNRQNEWSKKQQCNISLTMTNIILESKHQFSVKRAIVKLVLNLYLNIKHVRHLAPFFGRIRLCDKPTNTIDITSVQITSQKKLSAFLAFVNQLERHLSKDTYDDGSLVFDWDHFNENEAKKSMIYFMKEIHAAYREGREIRPQWQLNVKLFEGKGMESFFSSFQDYRSKYSPKSSPPKQGTKDSIIAHLKQQIEEFEAESESNNDYITKLECDINNLYEIIAERDEEIKEMLKKQKKLIDNESNYKKKWEISLMNYANAQGLSFRLYSILEQICYYSYTEWRDELDAINDNHLFDMVLKEMMSDHRDWDLCTSYEHQQLINNNETVVGYKNALKSLLSGNKDTSKKKEEANTDCDMDYINPLQTVLMCTQNEYGKKLSPTTKKVFANITEVAKSQYIIKPNTDKKPQTFDFDDIDMNVANLQNQNIKMHESEAGMEIDSEPTEEQLLTNFLNEED